MSNEITLNLRLDYANGSTVGLLHAAQSLGISVDANQIYRTMQTVGSSEEPIRTGELATLGWFIATNRGPTDTISIRAESGASDLVDLVPGDVCCFRFDPGVVSPYAIASSVNAPVLEYLLIED